MTRSPKNTSYVFIDVAFDFAPLDRASQHRATYRTIRLLQGGQAEFFDSLGQRNAIDDTPIRAITLSCAKVGRFIQAEYRGVHGDVPRRLHGEQASHESDRTLEPRGGNGIDFSAAKNQEAKSTRAGAGVLDARRYEAALRGDRSARRMLGWRSDSTRLENSPFDSLRYRRSYWMPAQGRAAGTSIGRWNLAYSGGTHQRTAERLHSAVETGNLFACFAIARQAAKEAVAVSVWAASGLSAPGITLDLSWIARGSASQISLPTQNGGILRGGICRNRLSRRNDRSFSAGSEKALHRQNNLQTARTSELSSSNLLAYSPLLSPLRDGSSGQHCAAVKRGQCFFFAKGVIDDFS